MRHAATVLMLGTLGALTAYLTGRAASQTLWFPGMSIGLLLETGDRGGRLVYQHGVGTART